MRKVILDVDPGLGDAVAVILALLDPNLDVVALTATGGSVSAAAATRNLQALVEQLDPPKWPRVGAAADDPAESPPELPPAWAALHGPTGLGEAHFTTADLHHRRESAKLLVDLVRDEPHEISLVTLGPLTNVMAACDRCPDFLHLLDGLYCLGGTIERSGDVSAAAEFNMFYNPIAARRVLTAGEPKTLIPLDVSDRVILTFEDFSRFPESPSRAATLLQLLLPWFFRAHHQFLGMEGIMLRELAALASLTRPDLFTFQRLPVDVETRGELTRGATIFDRRARTAVSPNVRVATEIDAPGVLAYMTALLTG